ncbi:MAG: hypothetical protein WAU53_21710 [Rhodoplanes sp.]
MRIIPPSGRAGNYHFTIDVYYNEAGAALTVPNGPFSNLRNFVKKSGEREFEKMIRQILMNFEKSGVIRSGGLPHIRLVQRRYRTGTEIYAQDGDGRD